ncbi:MAG: DUF560 domain-containing protein [Desulfobacteraceae bacterium]|nr:DUF560 domain-containing protein [Desulfobacteraceae bacterium]
MVRIGTIILIFFFCVGFSEIQATPGNPISFDDYLKQGIDDFKSQKYRQAYEVLLEAFNLNPGNYEVNFYLGRAAFEIHNYEMAVMIYERALIINPKNLRVKLEMARSYQKLGMNDMARKYCNEVLLTDPPQAVKLNIETFLAYIDRTEQKHFFRGTLSLGVDWNDNIWASPTDDAIATIIGEITLTGKSAQETQDTIFLGIGELNHTYIFPYSNFAWQSNLSVYKAIYNKENDLDTLYLNIESGPEYIKGKGITGLLFTTEHLDLGKSKYLTSLGVKTFYRYMFTPSFVLSPSLAYKNKTYEKDSKKNADNLDLAIDTAFLTKGFWVDTTLGYEHESAADNEHSYNRYKLCLDINRELGRGFTAFASYNFFHTRYDDAQYLFNKARKDNIHYLGCGLKKRLWQSSDRRQSLALTLGYQYTNSQSNLDLYQYTRNVVNSSMEYRF